MSTEVGERGSTAQVIGDTFMSDVYLVRDAHIPKQARFPVIDAHNHLWSDWASAAKIVHVLDEVGVAAYCDLTANIVLKWENGGYVTSPGDFKDFLKNCVQSYPGRFYGFTTATFNGPINKPLFTQPKEFVARTIAILNEHHSLGAKGLKILKEFGLHYRDGSGALLRIDDDIFAPIWEAATKLAMPVLIHQSDPYGFFEPVTPENEHYDSLQKYPAWRFSDPIFPRKMELLERRNNLIRNNPRMTFLLPHVANYAENLEYVAKNLDEYSNIYIDFSARMDELGRQPYSAREFLIKYQDRIFFGTDMPASSEMYRCYFRFLESWDEYFIPPDYDGTFGRHRWRICGIGLPDEVLKKLYYKNVLKIIPGLEQQVGGFSNALLQ